MPVPSRFSGPELQFDLSPLREADRKWKLVSFWTLLLVAIMLSSAVVGAFAARGAEIAHAGLSASWLQVFGLAFLGSCVVFILVVGLPSQLAGAYTISIDDAGVVLRFRRGPTERHSWQRTGRFFVRDASMHPRVQARGIAYTMVGSRPWARQTVLSKAAVAAVLDSARSNGCTIATSTGSPLRYGVAPLIYTITSHPGPRTR